MISANWFDLIVIVVYFLFILYIGTLFGRYTKTTKDFFFGGQRFAWWLVAMSCVATVVGSYSFIKYAERGYRYGFSSTMTYLNDWFIVPFFVLGWLPIIYFNRISSIPEYFERRYDRKTRLITVFYILLFMTGYIGINFYTVGTALRPLLNLNSLLGMPDEFNLLGIALQPDLYIIIIFVAIVGAIYMHAGGQTSVIMTDLIQGFVLLTAGFIVLYLGLEYIGGWRLFFSGLSDDQLLPFTRLNEPADFSHAGVFWQDAAASSVAFYFMNQGTIMRFMSAKSPKEGRRAIFAVVLVLMPLAVLAIANTGWLGRSMVTHGLLDEAAYANQLVASGIADEGEGIAKHIFVIVADIVCRPGIFGFVLAALTAAMMSTIDTLINAVTAIFLNDIYRPYVKAEASEAHYLKVARIVAIVAAVVGVCMVPFFAQFRSIFKIHAMFTATVTPPLITVILLSIFSRRVTTTAAFFSLLSGFLIMLGASLLASPDIGEALTGKRGPTLDVFWMIGHGIDPIGGYPYIRALFGILVTAISVLLISLFTKPKAKEEISGLTIASVRDAQERFKGGSINDSESGTPVRVALRADSRTDTLRLSHAEMKRLDANEGDLLYVADRRWWLGGLKSLHVHAGAPHDDEGIVYLSGEQIEEGQLVENRQVVVERLM